MNKSIVYLFVISSFIIGCGQGFDGNLSSGKGISPFKDESNAKKDQQQTDTTRPNLQDTLQASADDEGVSVIWNMNENVDGNTTDTTTLVPTYRAEIQENIELNNNEIVVQGGNWSRNKKLKTTVDLKQAEQKKDKALKDTKKIKKSSDEEGASVAWTTTNENTISTEEIKRENNQDIQKAVMNKANCPNEELFNNHQKNIENYISVFSKTFKSIKIDNNKYRFESNINCVKLNKNAGTIFSNLEKLNKYTVRVISQGRPSMKPLKLAFANIVKQKTKKLDGSFTINLITDSELDTSSISVEELAQEISQTKNTMPVLINSEEAFKLWADAIKLLSK